MICYTKQQFLAKLDEIIEEVIASGSPVSICEDGRIVLELGPPSVQPDIEHTQINVNEPQNES